MSHKEDTNRKTSSQGDVAVMMCYQKKYVRTNDFTTVTGSCIY